MARVKTGRSAASSRIEETVAGMEKVVEAKAEGKPLRVHEGLPDPDWTKVAKDIVAKPGGDDWEDPTRGGIVRPADRPAVWLAPDGVWEYRASEFGSCIRAMVCARRGMQGEPSPERLQKAFQEGHDNEPRILSMAEDSYGIGIGEYQKGGAINLPGKPARVWGHADGITVVTEEFDSHWSLYDLEIGAGVLVEAKAFGPDYYKKFRKGGLRAFPGYSWQMSTLMIALGLPYGLFVVGQKDDGGVVQGVTAEIVVGPPMSKGAILAKMLKVEKLAEDGELPACDIDQYPCPFYPWHEEKADGDELPLVEDGALRRAIASHAYWAESERNAKAGKETAKQQIREAMDRLGLPDGEKRMAVDGDVRYEFSWVVRDMPERTMKASQQRFPQVKILGKGNESGVADAQGQG